MWVNGSGPGTVALGSQGMMVSENLIMSSANAEDKYTQDIQKTIQSWGTKSSALYEFYCSPLSDCDANFDRDQCLSHDDTNRPRLYFIMTAIKNFNNWMLSVWRAVEGTSSLATTLSSDMVDTFAENIEKVVRMTHNILM